MANDTPAAGIRFASRNTAQRKAEFFERLVNDTMREQGRQEDSPRTISLTNQSPELGGFNSNPHSLARSVSLQIGSVNAISAASSIVSGRTNATGFFERSQRNEVGLPEQLAMTFLGMIVMLVLNGYLLATRGQTIGKLLTKIQIVDVSSGRLLPILRVYVYRYLWTFPLFIIAVLIPGSVDDLLVNLIVLIDLLMIFGADRRCLHDFIAGSKVVLYKADRQFVGSLHTIVGDI